MVSYAVGQSGPAMDAAEPSIASSGNVDGQLVADATFEPNRVVQYGHPFSIWVSGSERPLMSRPEGVSKGADAVDKSVCPSSGSRY